MSEYEGANTVALIRKPKQITAMEEKEKSVAEAAKFVPIPEEGSSFTSDLSYEYENTQTIALAKREEYYLRGTKKGEPESNFSGRKFNVTKTF